ncbi:hypothetical protein FACS189452_00160 [Bacteroidia bacterium]|nr:hypothetical protein FACS189452_00160 [Bacteroidia bacterium]
MCATLAPSAAFAAGVPGENFSVSNNATLYATLAEAAAAVADGGTITMLQNVTVTNDDYVTLNVAKTYTIDLGGYTLESSGQYALAVSNGTVTVKNGAVTSTVFVFGGKLIVESGAYSGLLSAINCAGGKVMIISGSFSYTSNAAHGCLYEFGGRIVLAPRSTPNSGDWKNYKPADSTVTVTAGVYTPEENFTLSGSAEKHTTLAEAAEDAADGDTITMLKNITTVYYSDIVLSADKTYTIDLGGYTLGSNFDNALQISAGRVTVSNGTVTSTIYVPGGRLIVESGSYSGYQDAIRCPEGKVTIVSGNFTVTNDDGNGCLAETGSGRIVLAKGSAASVDPWKNNASATNVTVTAGSYTPVANFSVSGSAVSYETLAEAAAAVADGDTITMLQAVTASDEDDITLSVNKTYTIDLGGYTLGSDGQLALAIYNGTVTISNGSVTASIAVFGGELIVESGSYSGEYAAIACMNGGKVTIISGIFTATYACGLVDDGDNQIVLARGSTASVKPWKNDPGAMAVTITAGEPVANFSVSGSAMTYETLVETAEAVANGDTITMLQNVTAGDASEVELTAAKTYTIDFGGYTIGCDEYAFAIGAGTVTVSNGNTTSDIVVTGGELIVESGAYSAENDAIYCSDGKVTIISGSFIATNDDGNGCIYEDGGEIVLSRRSIANIDPWKNDASATTVIVTVRAPEANFSVSNNAIIYNTLAEAAQEVEEGGTITMLKDVTIYDYADVTLTANKSYTIDLGGFTLASDDENGLIMESGTVTVKNGSITKDILVDGGRLIIENGAYSGGDDAIYCTGGRVTIISGTFTATGDYGDGCLVENGGIIALAGGSTADVNPWKNPAGAAAVIVTAGEPVENFSVSGSTVKYETLAEAAQAVAAGGTITMLQDVTAGDFTDITLDMAKTYTIDLGGNTLGSDVGSGVEIYAGTITVSNGTLTSSIFVDGGELVIEDGSYSGEYFAIYALSGKVTIISGIFSYTSEGYALGCLAENGGEIILAPGSTADVDPWKNDASVTVVTITAATTYGVSIAALSNGSVSADKADYEAGETVTLTIAPDAGYELKTISAHKTGDVSVTVPLTVLNVLTRNFTMPDYGVTVAATFQPVADPTEPTDPTGVATQGVAALHIYPNPVSDQLTVTSDQWNAVGAGSARPSIEIYNVNGTKVFETPLSIVNYPLSINIAHLPAGIYIVKVGNKVAKVVKQ